MHQDPFHSFNSNAASMDESLIKAFVVRGDPSLLAFIGGPDYSTVDPYWTGPCVLSAEKGYGKSHLLKARSFRMRDSKYAPHMIFHPDWHQIIEHGSERVLVESMDRINGRLPNWLDSKSSGDRWEKIWQLSITGLLVVKLGVDRTGMDRFSEAFGLRADSAPPEEPRVVRLMSDLLHSLNNDIREGTATLQAFMHEADQKWVPAIKAEMKKMKRDMVEMYLDNPDESFNLVDQPVVWTWVQQGLLTAIWRMRAQSHQLSSVLRVYCVLRREAFDGRLTAANLQQAKVNMLEIEYESDQLKAMLDDRIRTVPTNLLTAPDQLKVDPLAALAGFAVYKHDDRKTKDGAALEEPLWAIIDRHTRRSPREVIEMGKAIALSDKSCPSRRSAQSIRRCVNTTACENVTFAIENGIPGWSDRVGNAVAKYINSELLTTGQIKQLSSDVHAESGSPDAVELLLRHGFLGYSDRQQTRHKYCYVQKFIEHSKGTSFSVENHYFFVHPAFKEWIRFQVGARWGVSEFECLKTGVVGRDQLFDSKEPTFRLTIRDNRPAVLVLGDRLPIARTDPPVFHLFLFLAVYTCAVYQSNRVTLMQIDAVSTAFRQKFNAALDLSPWPQLVGGADRRANSHQLESIRSWAKDCKKEGLLAPFLKKATPNAKQSLVVSVEGKATGKQGIFIPALVTDEVDIEPCVAISRTQLQV